MRKLYGFVFFVFGLCQLNVFAADSVAVKKIWNFSSKNSLVYFEGNVNKLDAFSNQTYERTDSILDISASYQFIYSENKKVTNNLEHLGNFTVDYRHLSRISPFTGLFVQSNRFRGYDIRATYLLGLKWKFFENRIFNLSVSSAGLYEYDIFSKPEELNEKRKSDHQLLRLSIRPRFKIKLTEKSSIITETFYQPDIQNFDDFVILSRTNLSLELSKHFSFIIFYQYQYFSIPVYSKLTQRDQKLQFGLDIKF